MEKQNEIKILDIDPIEYYDGGPGRLARWAIVDYKGKRHIAVEQVSLKLRNVMDWILCEQTEHRTLADYRAASAIWALPEPVVTQPWWFDRNMTEAVR